MCPCVYIQHHQAAQLAEGMVGDVVDVVEGKRHGLQGRQLAQSLHRDLRQRVVIQPEVTEGAQARETAGGDPVDMVGIQTPIKRCRLGVTLGKSSAGFAPI